jgi:altronate hydrolase
MGYLRENGEVGIRNEVWIIPTVGCVNKVAERIAAATGAYHFPHPFGCSQLGDDQAITQKILKGLVNHPNAAGVLVLGLGCENNNIEAFRSVLGEVDERRVKFLIAQECEDEVSEGIKIVNGLFEYAKSFKRVPLPVSKLTVGLKCGGSDGYSGISANPLVGRFSDKLITEGGSCLLTEVPEMFGAEHLFMQRCESEDIFNKTVSLINDFKDYYTRHGQVIYENPSPGNKKGGITTLEEKSLGCVQKGGLSPVVDVLDYGDRVKKSGLSLLNGPGNDIVAITNLAAAGAHLILFTTGRGTPVGSAVPTVKISTNRPLAERKSEWIDFDSSPTLSGETLEDELFDFVLKIADGEETKNEKHGYREISIFKDGVTL